MHFFFEDNFKIKHSDLKLWSQKTLDTNLPDWIQQIHSFLCEWFSSDDSINVYTSGTTTNPKKIKKKKTHLEFSALETLNYLKIPKGSLAILCLQAKYIAARLMIIRALIGHLDLYCIEPSAKILEYLQKKFPQKNFDFIALVPYQLNDSLFILKNIKNILIGGSYLSGRIKNHLKSIPSNIFETFGMAETLTHIALKPINNQNQDVFFTLPSVEIATTKKGELKIKSPPRGLEKFLITKDIIKIHSSTSFYYLGRADFIIQTGSLKIHPEVLEAKMQQKIAVLQNRSFFIDALFHPKLEKQLILIIETEKNEEELFSYLQKDCKKHLEFFEVPKKILFFPKFLRSKNMKILRRQTKKLAINYL